jgi:hypothetical protein
VHHTYCKIADFWLPAENESYTDVRLGGHATLSIHYGDYKLVSGADAPSSGATVEKSGETAMPGNHILVQNEDTPETNH